MPRTLSDSFLAAANSPTARPVWLYRIEIGDGQPDLFLAGHSDDVAYFKDVNTPQTYIAAQIWHSGLSENTRAQVDTVEVTLSNVNRDMQAFSERHGGLRGKKVTIWQAWTTALNDPSAHSEDVFYIDRCALNVPNAVFYLTSKLDLLSVETPGRMYSRDHCPWTYKGKGCWIDNGDGTFTQPSNFSHDRVTLHSGNKSVKNEGQDGTREVSLTFTPVALPSLDIARDYFLIDLCAITTRMLYDWSDDTEAYYLTHSFFSDPTECFGSAWNLYLYSSNNAYLRFGSPQIDLRDMQDVDFSFWSSLTYPNFYPEIVDYSGAAYIREPGAQANVPWRRFAIHLSDCVAGGGTFDRMAVNKIRWVQSLESPSNHGFSADKTLFYNRLYIRNLEMAVTRTSSFIDGPDQCEKSYFDCQRHNNIQRFGGFPQIPKKAGRYV